MTRNTQKENKKTNKIDEKLSLHLFSFTKKKTLDRFSIVGIRFHPKMGKLQLMHS
jgi:hypothetical protein